MRDLLLETIQAYKQGKRYIIHEGGTRSGKSFTLLTFAFILSYKQKNSSLFSVVSETFPHLRKGVIRDFHKILQDANAFDPAFWNKTESIYKVSEKNLIEFFSCDSSGKVHGPAREFLFINEAQNISFEVFKQLAVRTTRTIFIDFNPTCEFWAHELKSDPDVAWIHSTYKDNPHLTHQQVKEIEKGKKNEYWWQVYGLGQIGNLDGLIFKNFSLGDYPAEPKDELIGLDFGFTNDPTAIIRLCYNSGNLYLKEDVYRTEMTNSDIAKFLKQFGNTNTIADSSEPKSIEEISRAGVNIKPAVKGPDSIMAGIQLLLNENIIIDKSSTNLIKEFRNYTWDKDKNDKVINKPIDDFNHGIDAVRYANMFKNSLRNKNRIILID